MFDGYDAPSTKDAEHSRRVASSREFLIEDNIHVSMSQQEFLGNTANKVRFVALLTSHLEAAGFEVHRASADADRLIVASFGRCRYVCCICTGWRRHRPSHPVDCPFGSRERH